MTHEPRSPAANRARRRGVAAQRRVIVSTLIAVGAALGVMWVARPVVEPAAQKAPTPAPPARPSNEGPPALPIPPSDADVLLVHGEPSILINKETLSDHAPVSVELAMPVRLVGDGVFETRVMTEGREMLRLEGRVRGPDRNVVRIDVPGGWLEPGTYLFEVETGERSHFPMRRFMMMVD